MKKYADVFLYGAAPLMAYILLVPWLFFELEYKTNQFSNVDPALEKAIYFSGILYLGLKLIYLMKNRFILLKIAESTKSEMVQPS